MMGQPRQDLLRPGALLPRLIVVLACALFGVPPGHADRSPAQSGPAAESRIDLAHDSLKVQRQLQRAQEPAGEDMPDPAVQNPALRALPAPAAVRIAAARHSSPLPAKIRILPPVRGPPAG